MAKRTYQEMLKENLNEFDTTKTVDVKGPMLDPILGYEGDGELPTYKDAASVLERYYFGEERKESEINEIGDPEKPLDKKYENDKGDSSGASMKNTEGPEGEQQAGTSNANTPTASEKEKEKDIVKEGDLAEKEMNTKDLKSAEMKDADGPEGEEQAGTGDTYKEFKKRVVESIEAIVESDDEEDEGEEDEKDEDEDEDKGKAPTFEKGVKPDFGKKAVKEMDEPCEKCGKKKCECPAAKEEVEEAVGAGAGPLPALAAKAKNDNKEGDEEDEYDDKKSVKEDDNIEVTAEDEDITEALENEIIEKLISEMEEEGEGDGDAPPAEEESDEADAEEEEGLDVDKKMEEMVNRLTQGPAEGPEGEEQAGTDGKEGVIPPRKDRSDEGDKTKGVKPMDKGELADA